MFSVIILHHDKAAYSHACLQSLLRSAARPLEVINVDNGSQDGTPGVLDAWEEAAQARGIQQQRHRFESNVGAVRGRNIAMESARGEVFVFLDNDTLVTQHDWLENLHDFLAADPRRAIVAPKLLFPWQPFLIECCGCGISRRGRVQYLGRGEPRESCPTPHAVQAAISAAWMMPRRLYETIGPLDEEYSPVQYEDLDYCYRARAAGLQVWLQPAVELYHFEHTTTAGSGDINFKYVTTKNGLTFKNRWSAMFGNEAGPGEAETAWKQIEKHDIADVDWQSLLPPTP
ncbi:MAG TPA: glycosyltransferase family 2 protein [Abditibacteriaceae bacterium]|nr:glycosyltransferase family 2 protein [Abditibacteriaceae bacterium]